MKGWLRLCACRKRKIVGNLPVNVSIAWVVQSLFSPLYYAEKIDK